MLDQALELESAWKRAAGALRDVQTAAAKANPDYRYMADRVLAASRAATAAVKLAHEIYTPDAWATAWGAQRAAEGAAGLLLSSWAPDPKIGVI